MITPAIEKAILNGLGEMRNFSIGGGGLCKIPIPVGHFGIITDFVYFPWYTDTTQTRTEVERFTFQEMCIYCNNRSNKWTFKIEFGTWDSPGSTHNQTAGTPQRVDTFMLIDTDTYVQFKAPAILNAGTGTITIGVLTASQAPTANETEGNNHAKSWRWITNANGSRYFPSTSSDVPTTGTNNDYQTISGDNLDLFSEVLASPSGFNHEVPMANVQVFISPLQNKGLL